MWYSYLPVPSATFSPQFLSFISMNSMFQSWESFLPFLLRELSLSFICHISYHLTWDTPDLVWILVNSNFQYGVLHYLLFYYSVFETNFYMLLCRIHSRHSFFITQSGWTLLPFLSLWDSTVQTSFQDLYISWYVCRFYFEQHTTILNGATLCNLIFET